MLSLYTFGFDFLILYRSALIAFIYFKNFPPIKNVFLKFFCVINNMILRYMLVL